MDKPRVESNLKSPVEQGQNRVDSPTDSMHGALWTTEQLDALKVGSKKPVHSSEWPLSAYSQIKSTAIKPDFPCFFAAKAFESGGQRFLFCESPDSPDSLSTIATRVTEYLGIVGAKTGWDALVTILFIVFRPVTPVLALDAYHAQGWKVLEYLHLHDPKAWPAQIPKDVEDPQWSFCYNGVPLFINMSCPAHHNRKSRNVGDSFVLIMQPREGFDEVAGNTPKGVQARKTIRARLSRYDLVGPSPALGSYGNSDTHEWRQYALQDDNEPRELQCPLRKLFPKK
jgi:FPC/CPF motif-containing protein YcgG